MVLLTTMTSSGAFYLEEEGTVEQWMRESSITHLFAVCVFVLLWKLHRFLGKTLFDDILNIFLFHSDSQQDGEHPYANHELPFAKDMQKNLASNVKRVPIQDDIWLQKQVPDATPAERLRFFIAKGNKADKSSKSLQVYMKWRKQYAQIGDELDYRFTGDEDLDHWNISALLALKLRGEKTEAKLAQFVRTYTTSSSSSGTCDLRDIQGSRIFHVLPGLIDERVCSTLTYASALAIYLDQKLSRESTEKIAVVVDVRGGMGWRNLHAANQLPFIQHTCQLLLRMFPERLSRAIVYPIPASFVWLWTMASRCIDVKTRDKIALLPGIATIRANPPTEKMLGLMTEETANRLEDERLASFVE